AADRAPSASSAGGSALRQLHGEGGASVAGLGAHGTAVRLGDLADDEQAQAQAGAFQRGVLGDAAAAQGLEQELSRSGGMVSSWLATDSSTPSPRSCRATSISRSDSPYL